MFVSCPDANHIHMILKRLTGMTEELSHVYIDREKIILHWTQRLNFESSELKLAVPYFVLVFVNIQTVETPRELVIY
jgi:hypothetical protein